ncbi:outer membrane lipoprotein LolB [Methylovulum psychrotolerans]|uniref:lipoprotein insertase outer membrane protein LolB n=1 Tax=Methylovulum psychrotolerans TaxID=1704499 RepID=UPI001BFF88B0|nr:lipoprotein insertase outer membrane protein LolB [Methylovulum psychrotolerans]MBT9097987.1 outer membrane lipoprotein LolB [Methylovulum psychrotolerans]
MRRPIFAALAVALWLSGCNTVEVIPDGSYSRAVLANSPPLPDWALEGRMSLSGGKEAWSANLLWQHDPAHDELKLSGPLGQGATIIRLQGETVSIDRGGGNVQTSAQPEAFINQQLGMDVPIKALAYWIVGLPATEQAYVDMPSGFRQAGWLVEYKQMQTVGHRVLPRKMTVMNGQAKLKLIIEQWVIKGEDGH